MKFLVLGGSGMAGHVIASYLYERGHTVDTLSRTACHIGNTIIGDARNFEWLGGVIVRNRYDIVVNAIGSLNQFAESDKANAVLLNSYLPHFLVDMTCELPTRVFHMSTDCVFSGNRGGYSEADWPDGQSFYDKSKALGEFTDDKNLTFRNSIIGPDRSANGIGLFNWFMKQNSAVDGFTKTIWSGVTTLTLAQAMERAAVQGLRGLYQLTNSMGISKYELLLLFNQYFKHPALRICPVEGPRQDKSLLNHRKDFSFAVPSYETMVREMRDWIIQHSEWYPHYKFGVGDKEHAKVEIDDGDGNAARNYSLVGNYKEM